MYKFRDTNKRKFLGREVFIPTSAMSYDNMFLEELLEGYQTLSVEGREMYSLDFETQDKLIGSVMTSVKYPSRTFTVKYKLEDDDPINLQQKFDKLLAFLIRENDVKIVFNDDPEYYFNGRYQASDSVAGDANSIMSSFTVFCSDPFKKGKRKEVPGIVIETLPYQVKPDRFEILMTGPILDATDGKYRLKVSSAQKGDKFIFDFESGNVFLNGALKNNVFDLDSDFKNIRLEKGSNFSGSNYDIKIKYRKAVL